jgi:hypothetical protein
VLKFRPMKALRKLVTEFRYFLLAIHSEKHSGKLKDCPRCAEYLETLSAAKAEISAIKGSL